MPIDPGYGERLARRVTQLITDAQYGVLHTIARTLAQGIDTPAWATDRLAALEALRQALAAQLDSLPLALQAEIEAVIAEAVGIGQATAIADITATATATTTTTTTPAVATTATATVAPALARAITLLAADTTATVLPVPARILRSADDVYRRVIADASSTVLLGTQTRVQAAQQALNRLTDQGLGGIVDKSGRRWSAESYVEMAVRTAAGRAAVDGHVSALAAAGLDLVIVSDAPRECPDCTPWETKVLSISGGKRGRVVVPSAVKAGATVTVDIAGSVAEARAAGLQHPNCRHNLSAYLPGATVAPRQTQVPGGYDATQRQRAIERTIRKWKQREASALDRATRREAKLKVKQWQSELRTHVKDNPGLVRARAREQIGRAR